MTYSELTDFCASKKVTVTKLAEKAGLTLQGLRKGMNNFSLGYHAIESICSTLEITPNQFFGWEDNIKKQQIQNGGVGNTQQMDTHAVDILHQQLTAKDEQLKTKDEQIREKDAQIAQLFKLLSK